jgi:hypothetical protein
VDGLQISAHIAPAVFGHSIGADTMEGDDGEVLPRTLNRQAGSRATYALSPAYADVWRQHLRQLVLARLDAILQRAHRAGLRTVSDEPLLVIKEVDDSHAADVVMSLFPRSRLLFLMRDGRDVLDSLLDANRPGGWLSRVGWGTGDFESEEERLQWVREHSRNWVARMNACRRAYDAHDPTLRSFLRYEDLLADTPAQLGELARWLGLPAAPKRIETIAAAHSFAALPDHGKGPGMFRRSATAGKWRDGLSDSEQEAAQEIMGALLSHAGYEA